MNFTRMWLKFTLLSDASLGRGDGVAGMVDAEIKHDALGLPYLSGKTLKGLLVAQCAEVLYSLEQIHAAEMDEWEAAAASLFGSPGSRRAAAGKLRVEDACLPLDLQAAVAKEFLPLQEISERELRTQKWGLKRRANLDALTALRRQTAIDAQTGAPLRNSLRTLRVVLRSTFFVARLEARPELTGREAPLLAACVSAFRRLGGSRNRGLGALRAELYAEPIYDDQANLIASASPVTADWLAGFEKEVRHAGH